MIIWYVRLMEMSIYSRSHAFMYCLGDQVTTLMINDELNKNVAKIREIIYCGHFPSNMFNFKFNKL